MNVREIIKDLKLMGVNTLVITRNASLHKGIEEMCDEVHVGKSILVEKEESDKSGYKILGMDIIVE